MTRSKATARAQLEALVWRHTHRDFRGKRDDGTKCVLHLRPNEGTCSVSLASLTVAELTAKLPASVQREASDILQRARDEELRKKS